MINKTITIKLNNLNQNKLQFLDEIFTKVQEVSNDYLDFKFHQLETKNYDEQRKHQYYTYINLNTSIIQQTQRKIDSLVKSYISWCKKKHKLVSKPEIKSIPIILRNDCFHIEENKNSKSFNYWLKFNRKFFPLNLSDYHIDQLQKSKRVLGSEIIKNKNNYELKLTLEFEKQTTKETKAIGVDLGIKNPITLSDGNKIGNGKQILHKKKEIKKKLKKNDTKLQNYTKDQNHKLSKQLIDYCVSQEINVLVLENLKGNNLSNKKFRKIPWAFKQLMNFISYKAELNGIKVINVNPKNTSIRCNKCGLESKDNRLTRNDFICVSCGHKSQSDINAAKNILGLYASKMGYVNLAY